MPEQSHTRYHGVAIGLHWLIAVLIIGMLAAGKIMENLDKNDPLRFPLTQWHKSFGIVLLFLVMFRLLWRLGHKPPALPDHMKPWELRAANLTHVLLYLLMIVIPLSGWIMVSASPLNLPTLLFNTFHWPHIPGLATLENKKAIAGVFHQIHAITASLMILMLLAHIGAALRHKVLLRDGVMARMSPTRNGKWVDGIGRFAAIVTLAIAGVYGLALTTGNSAPLGAGDSDVGFTFTMMGEESQGAFPDSSVQLTYSANNLADSSLVASVNTASAITGDMQVDSSLSDPDWFDSTTFPTATFTSTSFKDAAPGEIIVTGILKIKDTQREIEFPMAIESGGQDSKATGGFTINRLDYDIGTTAQPDDSTVGYNVVITFSFEVN